MRDTSVTRFGATAVQESDSYLVWRLRCLLLEGDSAKSPGNDDPRPWLLRTRKARPSKVSGTTSAGLPSRSQLRLRRAPWTISAFRADAFDGVTLVEID